jgi:hypothetical protein
VGWGWVPGLKGHSIQDLCRYVPALGPGTGGGQQFEIHSIQSLVLFLLQNTTFALNSSAISPSTNRAAEEVHYFAANIKIGSRSGTLFVACHREQPLWNREGKARKHPPASNASHEALCVDVYRHRDIESSAAQRISENQRPATLSLWPQPYSVNLLTCACRIELLKKVRGLLPSSKCTLLLDRFLCRSFPPYFRPRSP